MSYLDCLDAIERPNSIGKPIPGGKFSLIDENGNVITQNWNEGEIVYEGPNVSFGYAEEKSDLSLGDENKGTLYTGDIGVRDDSGFFYIKGRSSRIAKINGIRINLQEVEDYLLTCNVTSAVISDDSKIYIFYESDIRVEDLNVRISHYLNLRPTSFLIKKLESLPRTTSGKIDMGSLGTWI